jgi:hypothetical protein
MQNYDEAIRNFVCAHCIDALPIPPRLRISLPKQGGRADAR